MPPPPKKAFPLRIEPALWGALERCAAADFRSVNAQIECCCARRCTGAASKSPRPRSASADGRRRGVSLDPLILSPRRERGEQSSLTGRATGLPLAAFARR